MRNQPDFYPPELEEREIPARAEHVWEVFWEIAGPEPLSFLEVGAYRELTGEVLETWEVRALVAMDRSAKSFLSNRATAPKEEPDA